MNSKGAWGSEGCVLQIEGTAGAKTHSQQSRYKAHRENYENIQSGGRA